MTDPIKIDIKALPYNNKNNDTPIINNVKVKYIATKQDKFGKEISYFKITNEIKQILGYLNGDLKCPFWVSEDGIILKVNKNIPNSIDTKGQLYEVIIEMNYYGMEKEGKEFKGYFAKLYT